MEQLVAEMAVACESHKAVLNLASTFWSTIQRLHVRGSEGVEMLKNDLDNNYEIGHVHVQRKYFRIKIFTKVFFFSLN